MGKPVHPAVRLLSLLNYSNLYITYCSLRSPLPTEAFEPTCHSAGRSTSMRFQTSLRWANIHAACPCSAHCLGKQTGHKQDNLIVPCCVPHGSVLSGFADGELSGVLPPDLLTWRLPRGGITKSQLTWFMRFYRPTSHTEHASVTVSCMIVFVFFFFLQLFRFHSYINNIYCLQRRLFIPQQTYTHNTIQFVYAFYNLRSQC